MRAIRDTLRPLLLIMLAVTLAGCGSSDGEAVRVAVIGEKGDPFETGIRLSSAGQLVRAATTEGLVAFDAEGRLVPALAERWTVTDDGKSYIFRLRDGTWRDGNQITSQDVRSALREAIRALRGSSLSLDLSGIEDIRAMTDRVVEIRLVQPMPHLLQLLAQPEMGLQYRGKLAGPMELQRIEDKGIFMPIRPSERGLPAIERWNEISRKVELEAFTGDAAVDRLNRGEADIVLGGTFADFPLTRKVGILRGTIQVDPVNGLFGLQVMKSRGFLAEPANREAIAMAIDREALIASFGLDGWVSTTRVVAPGLDGDTGKIGERWGGLSLKDRMSQASARVRQWKDGAGQGKDVSLGVWMPNGPGADLLFASLARDMSKIGVEILRAGSETSADLRLIDDVARYSRAMWFLNRLSCASRRGLCDKGADTFAAVAMRTEDPAEHAALIEEAEVELTVANVFIPFGAPIRWSLVRSDDLGFVSNRLGWHPLMPMAIMPR